MPPPPPPLKGNTVYRSPSVPLQQIIILSRMLDTISDINIPGPTIILVGFNEHIFDSRIVSLMFGNGYTQLVQSPTTAKGTHIDHVYCNRASDNTIVQVHDTVYCSIPLTCLV